MPHLDAGLVTSYPLFYQPGLPVLQGTIDFKNVYMITDAIALVAHSRAWTPADSAGMRRWMATYVQHLQAPHCWSERCSNNNHGTYFDVQYLTVLRYVSFSFFFWGGGREFFFNRIISRRRSCMHEVVTPNLSSMCNSV